MPTNNQQHNFLNQISFLKLHSHPISSSTTLHNTFLQKTLFCDPIPPPPTNINTTLPKPNKNTKTLKKQLINHIKTPFCTNYHKFLNIPKLKFKNFNKLNHFQLTNNNIIINPSKHINKNPFSNFSELTTTITTSPKIPHYFIEKILNYTLNHPTQNKKKKKIEHLNITFKSNNHKIKNLLLKIIINNKFHQTKKIQ